MSTTPLEDLSRSLAALPARFHLCSDPPADAFQLAALSDGATVVQLLDRHAEVRGLTDSDLKPAVAAQIAASLTVQGVSMRLLGAVLAGVVLHGQLLEVDADHIYVTPEGPSFRVDVTAGVVHSGDPAELSEPFAELWLDGHARELVDNIRAVRRVGESLLWGNISSTVASSFVFFDWWDPACEARRLAEATLDLGRPPLREAAHLTSINVNDRVGLRSERNNCCLAAKLPDPHLCPTCPLISEAERQDSTRQHIGHLHAIRNGAAPGPPPWVKQP